MGVEIIAQQPVVASGATLGVCGQPPLGRIDFAILFGLPVLRKDKLWAQGHHLTVTRAHDDWGDGTVEVGDLAVGVPQA